MPTDRISAVTGEIENAKGTRAAGAANAEHEYTVIRPTKPRRNARRAAALDADINPDEYRAAPVDGSLLERIVFKRLETIWGPPGKAFVYKWQIGGAPGVKNARAFAGGVEMDFVILNRPSGKDMGLEVEGAHWHGPTAQYADTERALRLIAAGFDFAEIWEWEIAMGDDFLDRRLLEMIGVQGRVAGNRLQFAQDREIQRFTREIEARLS